MDDKVLIDILFGHLRTIALRDNFDTADGIREYAQLALDDLASARQGGNSDEIDPSTAAPVGAGA
jgi:hypothetical protein